MTAAIKNHRLVDATMWDRVPMGGPLVAPRFIVIHITAGGTGQSSINGWIRDRKASAHTVIDRDGTEHQCVPFNRIAYHAGVSSWRGRQNLNNCSIGIEIANWGDLRQSATGAFVSWANRPVPHDHVIMARHKFGGPVAPWEVITEAQIEAVCHQIAALKAAYPSLIEVVGHCDIAPARRRDPGPAAPMERFAAALAGRAAGGADLWRVASASGLNIRAAPSSSSDRLGHLADGALVTIEAREGAWRRIATGDPAQPGGWVHGAYLIDVIEEPA